MKRILEAIGKVIDTASGIYCYIGMTIIFLYSFLLTFEAISRYLGFITLWIHWGAIAVIATIPYFTAAYVQREWRHVRVSLFEGMMPARTRIWSQLFGYFIFLIFCGICAYYLWWTTAYAYRTGEIANIVTVPTWPLYFVASLGMSLLTLQVIRGMGTLLGHLSREKDSGKNFFGKPYFVVPLYALAIAFSIWLFTVNPTAGVFTMILVFLFCAVPIAAGIGSVTLVALYWWGGFDYMGALGLNLYKAMEDYTWLAFPLFVFGGFLMQQGMAAGLFKVIANWMGWIPGGIGVAVVWTAVVLGAMLGSVYACVATLFILALPELDKRGYKRELTLPMFASASVLAYLIPPSIGLVIYGALTEQSIGALFMASVGPGIVLAIVYSIYVIFYCWRHGPFESIPCTWKERFTSIPPNFLALVIPFLVVGTIIAGIFTPTEAAAVAVVYIFFVNLIKKDMKFDVATFKQIFNSGADIIGFMGILIVGALLSKVAMMQFHVAENLAKMVSILGMNKLAILFMMSFLLFLMGCIGEVLPVVIILIPTIFPVLYKLGFHPWWLCVYLIFMGAIGGLTPPVGGVLFATAGMAKVDPYFIFRRVTPWVIMDFIAIIVMYLWPELVTALPYFLGFTAPPGF